MTTPARQNTRSRRHAALLLAGAWAFALCVIFAAHELGHLLALRLYGVTEVRIVLHPFTGARTVWNATNEFLGVVDAAGPLASIMVGVGISAARRRACRCGLLWPCR